MTELARRVRRREDTALRVLAYLDSFFRGEPMEVGLDLEGDAEDAEDAEDMAALLNS